MSILKRPPLRYHGGKWRIAHIILEYFPPHTTYVEPFGGGASVLLRKRRSKNEIYNDLDSDIVNVFKVLRDPIQSKELLKLLELTPFSREEMVIGWQDTNCPIEQARRCLVRSHMGFGSAGATKGRTGFRGVDCYENSYSAPAKQWNELPIHLSAIIQRLKGVVLENTDALKLIEQTNIESTLLYIDPPYIPSTRSSMKNGMQYYRHEMTEEDHVQLLEKIINVKSQVIISGYKTSLYMDMLHDWKFITFKARASSKKGTVIRDECLWIKPTNKNNNLFF